MDIYLIEYHKLLDSFRNKVSKKNLNELLFNLEQQFIDLLLSMNHYLSFISLKVLLDKCLNKDLYYICNSKHMDDSIYCNLITIFKHNNKLDTCYHLIKKNLQYSQEYIQKQGYKLHILIDIDDTLFPSNSSISGSDTSWYPNEIYPGLELLFTRLYQSNIYHNHPSNLIYSTILSATPLGKLPILGDKRKERIINSKIESVLGKYYSFLHGQTNITNCILDIVNLQKFKYSIASLSSPNPINLSRLKIIRFQEYKLLFPEYYFCFIGDNGQGDLIVGQHILDNNSNNIVCIHNILERPESYKNTTINTNKCFLYHNILELSYIFFQQLHLINKTDYELIKINIKKTILYSIVYHTNKKKQNYLDYINQYPNYYSNYFNLTSYKKKPIIYHKKYIIFVVLIIILIKRFISFR